MKKFFLIATLAILFVSCADNKTIDGTVYKPYGIANEQTAKNDSIQYEISAGSVIVAIIFSETIIVPAYTVGWDLWAPVSKLNNNSKNKGVVN